MIHLVELEKTYHTEHGTKHVLRRTNLSLPVHRRIAVLGANGAGKSTLMRLIAGMEVPTHGRVVTTERISWPLGFSSAFLPTLSGRANVAFVARIYGADIDRAIRFVEDFSELGTDMMNFVRTYSTGMRARLAFSVSMALEFDCYLVDEITAVGDRYFQAKCRKELLSRSERSGMLFASHNDYIIKQYCEMALVIRNGTLFPFDSTDEAVAFYSGTT